MSRKFWFDCSASTSSGVPEPLHVASVEVVWSHFRVRVRVSFLSFTLAFMGFTRSQEVLWIGVLCWMLHCFCILTPNSPLMAALDLISSSSYELFKTFLRFLRTAINCSISKSAITKHIFYSSNHIYMHMQNTHIHCKTIYIYIFGKTNYTKLRAKCGKITNSNI